MDTAYWEEFSSNLLLLSKDQVANGGIPVPSAEIGARFN